MDTDEHPALKNFSPTWESIKHVTSKVLTWGAIAAVAFAFGPAVISTIVSILPGVKMLGVAKAITLPALTTGATVGAIFGAIMGVSGLGKALDERRQDVIADGEQAMLARERQILLAQGRGQSFAPNSQVAIGNVAYRAPGKNQGNQGMTVG